ncbi:MAG: plasmid mobilization protein [Chitinophagaceae bacterium]
MRMMETVKKTKKKPGRPAITIKRENRKTIRFSGNEYFIIKENAAKAGLKPSEYIRQTAIYSTIKARLTQEERLAVKALIGMANNINQIAKACHRENVLQAMFYFQHTIKQLDEILKKLKNDK